MTNLNAIIHRSATSDFDAFRTANAMQRLAHVDVFSIVENPSIGLWRVFAKYASDMITTDEIDAAIDKELA